MSNPNSETSKERKSIYDVGYLSIFLKNFTQGFARGLGMITAYILLGGIIYYLATTYILPQAQSFLKTKLPLLTSTIKMDPQDLTLPEEQQKITPEQIQSTLELYQEQKTQSE
jgi:hypothetical protein